MMNLLDDIEIQCEKCGQVHVVSKDFLEPNESSYERSMGDEIEYLIEDFIVCDECQNEIKFVIRGYEYPVGLMIMMITKFLVVNLYENLTWELYITKKSLTWKRHMENMIGYTT